MYPFQLERVTVTDGIYLQIFQMCLMAQDQPNIGGKMIIGSGMVVFPFLAALEAANREATQTRRAALVFWLKPTRPPLPSTRGNVVAY
jgi:hypothetical protein